MALPSGCVQYCRPNRKHPRIYRPSDLTRIARYVLESHGKEEVCDAIRKVVRCCETDCGDAIEELNSLDRAMVELRSSGIDHILQGVLEVVAPFVTIFRGRRLNRLTILFRALEIIEAIAGLVSFFGDLLDRDLREDVQTYRDVLSLYGEASNDIRNVLETACNEQSRRAAEIETSGGSPTA